MFPSLSAYNTNALLPSFSFPTFNVESKRIFENWCQGIYLIIRMTSLLSPNTCQILPKEDQDLVRLSSLEFLPSEFLLQIINDVDREDIQFFARCCVIVWKVAEKVFDVHKWRRRYHIVRLRLWSDDPLERLQDLLMDDALTIYPRKRPNDYHPLTIGVPLLCA